MMCQTRAELRLEARSSMSKSIVFSLNPRGLWIGAELLPPVRPRVLLAHLFQHHHGHSCRTSHVTQGPDRLLPAGAIVEGHLEDWALQKSPGFKPDEEEGKGQDFPPSRQATAIDSLGFWVLLSCPVALSMASGSISCYSAHCGRALAGDGVGDILCLTALAPYLRPLTNDLAL